MIALLMSCSNEVPLNEYKEELNIIVKENEILSTTSQLNLITEEEEVIPIDFDILFSSERGGDRDLYLYSAEEKCSEVIIDLESKEGHGDFAPDGYTIVFFSTMDGDRELYTLDTRNPEATLKRLTDSKGDDHLPDFSPDGKKIVFESNRDGNSEIYMINADGSDLIRLTNNSVRDKQPKFSPDGQSIGYTTFENGIQKLALFSLTDKEIVVLETKHIGYIDFYDNENIICHSKNSSRTELFTYNILSGVRTSYLKDALTLWVPVYSHDKQWLAYNKEAGFGSGEIFIRNIESGVEYQITDDPSSDWGPDFRPIPPKEIIFFDSNLDGDRDIYAYNTTSDTLTNLTNNTFEDGIPFLSPDKKQLVFFSNRDGDDEIYTMNIDGSNIKQLTFNDSEDRAATWSHDGQSIAFSSTRDGDREIYIMTTNGDHQTQLTDNNSKDFWPAFSVDDNTLTYTHFTSTQDTYSIDIENWQNKNTFTNELLLENCSRCEFSPSGEKIAYSTRVNGIWQIASYNFITNETIIHTSNSQADWVPVWLDEETLLFSRESAYKASIVKHHLKTGYETILIPDNSQNWRPVGYTTDLR